jgi:nucleotide-binding universal stress UspA family protein
LILLPLGIGPHDEPKLAEAVRYARALQADVLLLHVLTTGTLRSDAVCPAEAHARAYLDTVAAYLHRAGVRARTIVRDGTPADVIITEASLHGATLLILGANTRSNLRSAVLGSVADQVVRRSSCPVLLVHAGPTRARALGVRSFEEDAKRFGPHVLASAGMRSIEVARIVGSVSRSRELGPDFRPKRRRGRHLDQQRYDRVRHGLESGIVLPPIKVYRVGFGYYVEDGHHRVAAALEVGQLEIDAEVTEYMALDDHESADTRRERLRFEQQTRLKDIGAARAESYRVLAAAVVAFAASLTPHDAPLAARRWHMSVYQPLWQRVREQQLTHYFPGERGADVVARLICWRRTRPDVPADWAAGLDLFATGLHAAAIASAA